MFLHSEEGNPTGKSSRETDSASLLSNPDTSVWEMIFDSLPDMVALIDLNNVIVKANRAMLQKLKVGEKAIIGHSCFHLMHENGCTAENCPHLQMMVDKKPHSAEMYEPKFGCYLNVNTTPIFDSNNNLLGSLHIARDISLQKESEEKLQLFNTELKELNQSKDKFFSIVAHDLRSPFQGMLGFTQLIIEELDLLSKEEIREYLQKVSDSSNSTFELLENLLNWSRLQTGRLPYTPVSFSIFEKVVAIISLLGSNAQSKSISLDNKINPSHLVCADKQMVHSMLLNLTSNAIKFSLPGGTITFESEIVSLCDNSAGGTCSCNRKCLQISVSDTGVGIQPEALKRLFENEEHFSLAGTANEQGAGLGLILVKEMAEKNGGSLTVSSRLGVGSVFAFTLLLAEP